MNHKHHIVMDGLISQTYNNLSGLEKIKLSSSAKKFQLSMHLQLLYLCSSNDAFMPWIMQLFTKDGMKIRFLGSLTPQRVSYPTSENRNFIVVYKSSITFGCHQCFPDVLFSPVALESCRLGWFKIINFRCHISIFHI